MGVLLLMTAGLLVLYNLNENRHGKSESEVIFNKLIEQIPDTTDVIETKSHLAMEYENETSELEEGVLCVDGKLYIGILTIPSLDLELPVLSEWNYSSLKISPCRYSGTAADGNLIIAAHNYQSHFGKINSLNSGDEVKFTDVSGHEYFYNVTQSELLKGSDVDSMKECSNEWDITLFTCTLSGRNRVTIRAVKK